MVLYAYNRDIPDAPNDPSADQPLMKTNFNNIDDIIDQDHFSFDENNGGLHRQVRLPLRGGSPGTIPPGLVAGEGTLYTKTVTSTGVLTETGLFYTPDNSTNQYQLTRTITASITAFGNFIVDPAPPAATISTYGWTFLPGGLLMQYGTISGLGVSNLPSTRTVNFPVTFSTGVFSITLTVQRDNASDARFSISRTTPPTTTTFTYVLDSGTAQALYWTAIGK